MVLTRVTTRFHWKPRKIISEFSKKKILSLGLLDRFCVAAWLVPLTLAHKVASTSPAEGQILSTQFQIREGIGDNSKIIFLISQ